MVNAIRPPEEHGLDQARAVFAMDEEACRKLYPQFYRGLVVDRLGVELFTGLPEGRLWPDEVLKVWIGLTRQGLRDKEELVRDREKGLTSEQDYSRLLELLEESAA